MNTLIEKYFPELIGTKILPQMMVDQQVKSSLLPFDAGEAMKAKAIKEAGLRVSTGVH